MTQLGAVAAEACGQRGHDDPPSSMMGWGKHIFMPRKIGPRFIGGETGCSHIRRQFLDIGKITLFSPPPSLAQQDFGSAVGSNIANIVIG